MSPVLMHADQYLICCFMGRLLCSRSACDSKEKPVHWVDLTCFPQQLSHSMQLSRPDVTLFLSFTKNCKSMKDSFPALLYARRRLMYLSNQNVKNPYWAIFMLPSNQVTLAKKKLLQDTALVCTLCVYGLQNNGLLMECDIWCFIHPQVQSHLFRLSVSTFRQLAIIQDCVCTHCCFAHHFCHYHV